jgi:hypothetical protein
MNEPTPDTPFPRHRYYYVALKFAVLLAALLLAIYVFMRFV